MEGEREGGRDKMKEGRKPVGLREGGSIKREKEREKQNEQRRGKGQVTILLLTWSNWNCPYGSSLALTTKIKVFCLPISAPKRVLVIWTTNVSFPSGMASFRRIRVAEALVTPFPKGTATFVLKKSAAAVELVT